MATASHQFVYGPVPSRRLGRSLGVDIIPRKTCPYDCIYCQLGRTSVQTCQRARHPQSTAALSQLRERLSAGLLPEFVTISGSGEPTLNLDLDLVLDAAKHMTQTPVAILTSGALLNSPRVRRTCALADVVLPTVTTTDPDVFQRIHRPASSLHVDDLWTGLRRFRQEYDGLTWLEVMLIPGINTDDASVEALSDAIAGLKPDRIQLNTPVRPTAEPDLHPLSAERLARIGEMLGPKAEVIADFDGRERVVPSPVAGDEVLALVSRRPCQLEDVASGLGIHPHEALKVLASLIQASRVKMHVVGDKRYFEATFAGS